MLYSLVMTISPILHGGGKLDNYALKLSRNACVDIIENHGKVVGINAYYINKEMQFAFISIISVSQSCRKQHIGSNLLTNMERNLPSGVNSIKLEVRQSNSTAIAFYIRNGYRILEEKESCYFRIKELNTLS